ncbi:glycosyltransferase family 4 protein [Halomonas litopenaei]|uniref:glycosyltransferase family 4 protein n=1 Tax=Halomonas litopenaei TaxID=2109328 RepID=UPI001A90735B|nr:glycosyltransferase family 1 protein [Halomonas litopenaei]MBN8411177.1 glycosyltransferase family 1 protein [Halomonas litopenaei]
MRICLVSETWSPDINGVAHTLGRISRELLALGVTLQLVRPEPVDASAAKAEGMEHELSVRGMSMPRYKEVRIGWASVGTLKRLWQTTKPDAIYVATEGPLGWSALRAAEKLDIPVVSGWHTNFDHYCQDYGVPWLAPLVRQRLRHFHNRCAATLVPTHQQARELATAGFERVSVMARGIEGDRFTPDKRSQELRDSWGVGQHQPVALYVGRLAPEKNLDLLRDTFLDMLEARPDMRLVVVGDGPGRASLEKALPDAIFTGFIDSAQMQTHYASADIFVFPSLSETWGNVILEAMASGLAVVAYRHAAGAELISTDHDGVSIPPGDNQTFRQEAVALCQQQARYARLGRAARERALAYRWPTIAQTFLDAHEHARHARGQLSNPAEA